MIDRQAPSTPRAGMSMRRIWFSSARVQGVMAKRAPLVMNSISTMSAETRPCAK